MIESTSLFLFLLTGMLSAQTIVPAGFGAMMSATQPSRETAVLTGILQSTGWQNPTVKIRWGDEDRETAVTPFTAWDNEVTVSNNQAAGTFSTTITIPNLEKVYYFRAIASNSGGTVVAYNTGDDRIEYIVETSRDLRTWNTNADSTNGPLQVGNAVDVGGSMEKVLYRSREKKTDNGGKQLFIRVRVTAKRTANLFGYQEKKSTTFQNLFLFLPRQNS